MNQTDNKLCSIPRSIKLIDQFAPANIDQKINQPNVASKGSSIAAPIGSKVFNEDRNCGSIKASYMIFDKHIISISFANKLVCDCTCFFGINMNTFPDNKRQILDNISNNKSFYIKMLDEYYGSGSTYIIFDGNIISITNDHDFDCEYLIHITFWDLMEIFEKIESLIQK